MPENNIYAATLKHQIILLYISFLFDIVDPLCTNVDVHLYCRREVKTGTVHIHPFIYRRVLYQQLYIKECTSYAIMTNSTTVH